MWFADTITEASRYAGDIDTLGIAFLVLAFLLSAPVFILMTWFAVKYRRGRPADRRHPIDRRVGWELSWTILPFLLVLGFYVWSLKLFAEAHAPPADAMEIDVVAKQWMWKFQHQNGQREIDALHVPAGEPVKLTMASQDVVHSLFVPALRLKQDVVPGRYTQLWFEADTPGTYRIACSQFCGTDHAMMAGKIVVMTPADFARWQDNAAPDQSVAVEGAALFVSSQCGACHRPAGNSPGPALDGLYGTVVTLADGRSVTADAQYLHDSILDPNTAVVAGYPANMPSYRGTLSEDDVLKLVAYIRALSRGGS